MYIQMFNGWYFFFFLLQIGALVGLYFALRKAPPFVQSAVLFSLLALGFIFHFMKFLIPPYADYSTGHLVITDRGWRDSWFVNICGANIGIFAGNHMLLPCGNVILFQNHRAVEGAGPYDPIIEQLAKPGFEDKKK